MPYVHPDGRVDYGHRAFAAILGTGPLPWRVVGRLMPTWPVDPVARRAYHWVAANRSRLPGGTPACSLEDRPARLGAQAPQASSQPSTSLAGRVLGPA